MSIGKAVVVGVSGPGPGASWSGDFLGGVSNDVSSMRDIFHRQGFQIDELRDSAARGESILGAIRSASATLSAGDMFAFFFAGHGLERRSADSDEQFDQLLCAYDRTILDDELGQLWALFRNDVRIVVITDSCHSGSVVRTLDTAGGTSRDVEISTARPTGPHYINIGLRKTAARDVQDRAGNIEGLKGSLIHMAACLDPQEAQDLGNHGAFTNAFLQSWHAGFTASYDQLFGEIRRYFHRRPNQTPQMTFYGWYQSFFRNQTPLLPAQPWPPKLTFEPA